MNSLDAPEPLTAALCTAPLPADTTGPVFGEPWQAQVFAMALALNQGDAFTWPRWAEVFSARIKARGADAADASAYYDDWLDALESIVVETGLTDAGSLATRKEQWRRAAAATPHGQQILLENDPGHGGRPA